MRRLKKTCPLGHKCQTFDADGLLEQCMWYETLAGKHPQTGEEVNESKCAIAWLPILAIEQSNRTRGATSAIESLRNIVAGQALIGYEDV